MPVYQNQGPQQYAMYQQSRKDDWIRQLLQMFMMKQQQGKKDERWEKEYELSKTRTEAYKTQAETQRKASEQPGKPSAFYEKFMTAYQLTKDPQKAYRMATGYKEPSPEEPQSTIPTAIDVNFKKYLIKNYGAGWREGMSVKDFEDIRDEWQFRTRPEKPEKPEKEPTITPTSKLTSRRIISSAVNKTFVDIQNEDPKAFENPEQIEAYRLRAEVDIDMPPKYTKVKRYMEQDLAKPEEIEYFNKATKTKAWLDKHPEIFAITDIGADALAKLDKGIVQSILDLRKKPGKNIFQKLGL